jgi:hypothetical protein
MFNWLKKVFFYILQCSLFNSFITYSAKGQRKHFLCKQDTNPPDWDEISSSCDESHVSECRLGVKMKRHKLVQFFATRGEW